MDLISKISEFNKTYSGVIPEIIKDSNGIQLVFDYGYGGAIDDYLCEFEHEFKGEIVIDLYPVQSGQYLKYQVV